jgi:hypothetical protein
MVGYREMSAIVAAVFTRMDEVENLVWTSKFANYLERHLRYKYFRFTDAIFHSMADDTYPR